jgi:tetratricopeptide (TPR) repeat protein
MHRTSRQTWVIAGLAILALTAALTAAGVWGNSSPEQLAEAARTAVQRKQWPRARSLLNKLLRRRARTTDDLLLYAELELGVGHPDEAIQLLTEINESNSVAARARLVAGQIEKKRDRARGMEAWFLEALRLDPSLAEVRRELIFLYAMQARRRDLNAQFQALAETETLSFDDVFLWTISFVDLWINDTIRPSLERYLAADAEDRPSRLALAAVMLKSGEIHEAESLLVPMPTADVDARVLRIRIALASHRLDRACEILSGGAREHASLALLRAQFAARSNDSAAAEGYYRTALRLDPHNHVAIQGLSLVLKQMGRIEESEKHRLEAEKWRLITSLLQKSKTFNIRDDVTLLAQLGAACEDVGLVAEACAWYRLAIGIDPLQTAVQKSLFRLRDRPSR